MKVIFDHSQEEAPQIVTYYFKPEEPMSYTAGQFIELVIPHKPVDSRGIKRWFTLSSSPTEELLSITTQIAKQDGSSFKAALQRLTPGVEVLMSNPLGDFVLPKFRQTPLVFVAGGIGITPFHSIFTWMSDVHETRPIKFIYSVETEEEIIFLPTIDKANIHATIVVEHPSPAWGGEQGIVTAEMILGLEQPTDNTLVYVSGPEELVDRLMHSLSASGLHRQQIVTDHFSGYKDTPK